MKTKICLIGPKFLKSIGGVETHGYEFVRSFLKDKKYEIDTIFSCKKVTDGINLDIKNKEFENKTKRILIKNIEIDGKKILKNSSKKTNIYFFNNPNWIQVAKLIKEKKPNSKIFVRSGGNDLMAGWILDESDKKSNLKLNRKILVDTINNYVEKLIVNSKYSKKRMVSIGINPNKLEIISGGVDCKNFKPKKNKKKNKIKLAFWGRLVKFKGLEYSIKAINEVYKHNKNIEFLIYGKGPEEEKIKKQISKLKLDKVVKCLGAKEFKMIPFYAQDVDIFLHLPIYLKKRGRKGEYIHTETMGRTYCEASALGIPIIASNVGGSPEMVIDGQTGFIVKEKDFLKASRKIIHLIENITLREKISKNARKIAKQNYDWNVLIKKYKKLFKNDN